MGTGRKCPIKSWDTCLLSDASITFSFLLCYLQPQDMRFMEKSSKKGERGGMKPNSIGFSETLPTKLWQEDPFLSCPRRASGWALASPGRGPKVVLREAKWV